MEKQISIKLSKEVEDFLINFSAQTYDDDGVSELFMPHFFQRHENDENGVYTIKFINELDREMLKYTLEMLKDQVKEKACKFYKWTNENHIDRLEQSEELYDKFMESAEE